MKQKTAYDATAKLFHWFVVVLVGTQFISAWIMPDIRGNQSPPYLMSIHMSFGVTIIFVMLLRMAWRLTHPVPSLPNDMPRWQVRTAQAIHYAFYLLLFVIPFTGWAWASSRGWNIRIFSIYDLPALTSHGSSIGHAAGQLHSLLATFVLLLIGLHVMAALYHYVMKKDGVMQRMFPLQKVYE